MVYRVYVEKKEQLAFKEKKICADIRNFLMIKGLDKLRLINRYDVEGINEKVYKDAVRYVFSEPQLDNVYEQIPAGADYIFAVEYLPGQFDQRADSAMQCIQLLSQGSCKTDNADICINSHSTCTQETDSVCRENTGEQYKTDKLIVKAAYVYMLYGKLTDNEIKRIKKYLINPVESREASLKPACTLNIIYDEADNVESLRGFTKLSGNELEDFKKSHSLAMDMDDLEFCRAYFEREHRDPSITEIRVIDTYWSDHCRHTTFSTNIDNVHFEDNKLKKSWARYMDLRNKLGIKKPISLMDMATIVAKWLKKEGKLDKLEESEEINACTVKIKVDVDGKPEDWLLLFKNETHNHPTEIEPFGGAATCIGGAIRDPLSSRAYVYAAMRVTGAADPTMPMDKTLEGKLPQKKLVITAAEGYSSYGNQIGVATGLVDEIYHSGYMAKRMEIGAVIAAAPQENIRRERPLAGDVVILLGGRTGRDGCGGATGSSKAHSKESLTSCGAEVQKGNAPEERKLQRLFRNPEATKLIKRCNDFGAGGVSVAIGELAEGLVIDLDSVRKKYEGLDGTELAISESQERMAVVVEETEAEHFIKLANAENLEAYQVARVTDEKRLVMNWRGRSIVDISRQFLDSNGVSKHIDADVPKAASIDKPNFKSFKECMETLCSDLNICSKRGLSERFDSSIGAGTVLTPFGGKYRRTPIQCMVHKISVESGDTALCSLMSYGYNPYISEKDQYKGAYLAVIESLSKLIAAGSNLDDVYLSFQEYFAKLGRDPERWAQPLSALLGAFDAQLDLGVAAIGGKDSMSGSFEQLDVPPTLVSFAVSTEHIDNIVSPEFKEAGDEVYLLKPIYHDDMPEAGSLKALYKLVHKAVCSGKVRALYTPTYGGVAEGVIKSCLGNKLGFDFDAGICLDDIIGYNYGSFIMEIKKHSCSWDKEGLNKLGIEVIKLGEVKSEYTIGLGSELLNIDGLEDLYEGRLEDVYPCKESSDKKMLELPQSGNTTSWSSASAGIAKPKMLIPVFPGTNCEYDVAKAAVNAGIEPEILVVRNLSYDDIEMSTEAMAKAIDASQIVFIPGGFSGGDEPEGSAKFIAAFFRNSAIKEAVYNLLNDRDGLMAGICNGFQALVKLGLLPYGEIRDTDASSPTLSFNAIARHQSKIVRTKIASNMSPWLKYTEVGEIYHVPISHGEGRFICSEEIAVDLAKASQIATQYVDLEGKPSMDVEYNPNASIASIEGITSPDGRIFGKMGHSERIGKGLYKNVPGCYDIEMFRSARDYYV